MKAIFKITALAALMVGATQMAHAGTNANVEITGNIVTHTCDLSVPKSAYDLGNHAATEFGTGGTVNKVGTQSFVLTVNNCTGTLAAVGDKLDITTNETGTTNGADPLKFFGADNGTNAGITLTMQTGAGTATDVSPASPNFTLQTAAAANEAVKPSFPVVVAASMKGAAMPVPGALKANLQFTMAP